MTRLDVLVARNGLAESRERAQALIIAGKVRVAGETVRKPDRSVADGTPISVESDPGYASRGALKLGPALDFAAQRTKTLRQQTLGIALWEEKDKGIAARDSVKFERDDCLPLARQRAAQQLAPPREGFLSDSVALELLKGPSLDHERL